MAEETVNWCNEGHVMPRGSIGGLVRARVIRQGIGDLA